MALITIWHHRMGLCFVYIPLKIQASWEQYLFHSLLVSKVCKQGLAYNRCSAVCTEWWIDHLSWLTEADTIGISIYTWENRGSEKLGYMPMDRGGELGLDSRCLNSLTITNTIFFCVGLNIRWIVSIGKHTWNIAAPEKKAVYFGWF